MMATVAAGEVVPFTSITPLQVVPTAAAGKPSISGTYHLRYWVEKKTEIFTVGPLGT